MSWSVARRERQARGGGAKRRRRGAYWPKAMYEPKCAGRYVIFQKQLWKGFTGDKVYHYSTLVMATLIKLVCINLQLKTIQYEILEISSRIKIQRYWRKYLHCFHCTESTCQWCIVLKTTTIHTHTHTHTHTHAHTHLPHTSLESLLWF